MSPYKIQNGTGRGSRWTGTMRPFSSSNLLSRRTQRPFFNLHLNTFHSAGSFAFISPIIFGNGLMSGRHNAEAYRRLGEPTPDANLTFHHDCPIWQLGLLAVQKTFQLDLLAVTKLFCPRKRFSLSLFSLLLSRSKRPSIYLGAMGKPAPNASQWLLISTICSALGPLISQRKSNMWRESDRPKGSLANGSIVRPGSAFIP